MTSAPCRLAATLSLLAVCTASDQSADAADAPRADASTYTLRYRFHPGQTLRWEVTHRKKVDATVSGMTQSTETLSKSVKVWQVIDVKPDGKATFIHLVESVDMWNKLSGCDEVRYSSRSGEKPPPGYEHVAQSVGVPLSVVTIDATGKILDRKRKQVKAAAQSEGQMTIPLPPEPVPVGHVWSVPHLVEVKLDTGAIKKVKTRQQFTLKSVRTGVATIQAATQILTPISDPAIESQLLQCESRGTVRFDIDAGRIIGQQLDADKRVVGHPNPASSFHYLTRFAEKLLPDAPQTASRPAPRRK